MFILSRTTWVVLLLACIGASWFSYQCLLMPHPAYFTPDWKNAQWMQAADAQTPVAYFRYVTDINVLPDTAFVMLAATQVFRLYVNGTFVASNAGDFSQNSTPMTYIYDVNALLHPGSDVLALRVANADRQPPSVRVSFGMVRGKLVSYNGSGAGWQATAQSTLVYPRYATKTNMWTTGSFASYVWPPAHIANNLLSSPPLSINPLLYEQSVASYWLSAGAGHDAYFVRQIPFDGSAIWLRLVANGTANVFINGHLLLIWNGQAPILRQKVASYLSAAETPVHYRTGLALGTYDVTPYFHSGINTLAIHVSNPGVSTAQVGLDSLQAALALDVLVSDTQGHSTWLIPDANWHVSPHFISNWENGANAALQWPSPIHVARPGVSSTYYLPETSTLRNTQVFPFLLVAEVVLSTCGIVVGLWLLLALGVQRRYYYSPQIALETLITAYVPALICEALLMVLSREPLLPQPFPYTNLWGSVLVSIVVSSHLLLWLNARNALRSHSIDNSRADKQKVSFFGFLSLLFSMICPFYSLHHHKIYPYVPKHIVARFYRHWMLLPLILISVPLSCYDLSYEPYWQDELSSYYAAHGVLAHYLPFFPSGFLYEKAELYSYMLALWTAFFGNSAGRFISVIEYIISIPLLYLVGCYFFRRRVALLASAMLALSPSVLMWARQVRMYEQAQVLSLLVMYLFCRAVQEQRRSRFLYIALCCLILDYLSHEEVFVILPALIVGILMLSRNARYRFPTVLYRKQWWCALAIGSICIATQLLLTHVTHPPVLGTDSSQRPFVQFSTDNISFYLDLLFFPATNGTMPWITLNSILATIGCIWARYDKNQRAKYCALFLCISFFTLMLIFTMQADRYFYPLLPAYYLMGAYAVIKMLDAVHLLVHADVTLQTTAYNSRTVRKAYLSQQMCWLLRCNLILACTCVLLAPMLPISNYNLFISRVAGLSYHRHYPDYDAVGQYMQQHWQKGDVVISVAPDFSVFYYTGHVNYFFSIDRALFLFERNGHIIDTSLGIQALLNQDDFRAVLAAHARIWIISDNAEYQAEVAKRFVFPSDFHIVFEGYGSAVYFRGDG
jgi:4-amino-4-deoxy-L-arabinose transferase-like glycosyltransferase